MSPLLPASTRRISCECKKTMIKYLLVLLFEHGVPNTTSHSIRTITGSVSLRKGMLIRYYRISSLLISAILLKPRMPFQQTATSLAFVLTILSIRTICTIRALLTHYLTINPLVSACLSFSTITS